MKKNIFGILACICILLPACSEQEDYDRLIGGPLVDKDQVNVRLTLSSIPEIHIDGSTDYRPASTRADNQAEAPCALIENKYKCLVIKEIGTKWYVDTVMDLTLMNGSASSVKVTENTKFKDIELTLRPGHYRALAVLNLKAAKWNNNLVPGTVVKGEADTVAHAYTYKFQTNRIFANFERRQVAYEVFAGTAEFRVEKTSDLHSLAVNGNTEIALTRKVMQLRFLLKDHDAWEPPQPPATESTIKYNFSTTQHTLKAILQSTQPDRPFCDGLDCWGDAYYNHKTPTLKLPICTDLDTPWRLANNNQQYKMISRHVTIYSPFVFTDDTKTVPYRLDSISITGQSGSDGFVYVYKKPIGEFVLKNNSIQPVVFQTTGEADPDIAAPQTQVTLEYLADESAQELFGAYYECNLP